MPSFTPVSPVKRVFLAPAKRIPDRNIFPDELVYRLVRMFSYEGDTVLDPFLGSGTTVKVARDQNREGIGYEREEQYKSVIMEKLGIGPVEAQQPEAMAQYARRSMAAAVDETAVAQVKEAAVPILDPVEDISGIECGI